MRSRIDSFLTGLIVMSCLVAATFFLKFWRETRDSLFLTFAVAFAIDGLSRTMTLWLDRPHEGHPGIYLLRLLTYGLILVAIVRKNYGPWRRR